MSPEPLLPPRLHPGQTLGLLAPAGPTRDHGRVEAGVAFLRAQGFGVKVLDHALDPPHGYLSAPDALRLEDLHRAFGDPEIHGILSLRGGYGCLRLLEGLDFDRVRRNPKVLIGFSDLTILHLALQARTGLTTFHGPMLTSHFGEDTPEARASFEDLVRLLGGGHPTWTFPNTCPDTYLTLRGGRAQGRLLGGNLVTLASLLGTPFMPDLRGAILFLEDLSEEPYRLDRLLTQMRLAGVLEGVAGLLLGDFATCVPTNPDKPSFSLVEVFQDRLGPLGVPMGYGNLFGHGSALPTYPVGAQATFDADQGVLTCMGPWVS